MRLLGEREECEPKYNLFVRFFRRHFLKVGYI